MRLAAGVVSSSGPVGPPVLDIARFGMPTAANTGTLPGVTRTTYSGPDTVSTNGTLIENKNIVGVPLTITGSNVIIRNCFIDSDQVFGIEGSNGANLTVENCEIKGIGAAGGVNSGILGSGTFTKNNIYGWGIGIQIAAGLAGGCTISRNYIHGLARSGAEPHYDGIAMFGNQVNGTLINHNTIDVPTEGGTSSFLIENIFGAVTNVTFRDNLCLGSPSYTISMDDNFSGSAISNVLIEKNFLQRGAFGYFSFASVVVTVQDNVQWQGGVDPIPYPAAPPPEFTMALPTIRDDYGAVGNGTVNDASSFAAVPAGQGAWVEPGTYRITTNTTINGHLLFMPGAVLKPSSGVTVTWAVGSSITAGNHQVFDDSLGGIFAGSNTSGWARSSWASGGSPRDLGVQLNKLLGWGFTQIDIPPAPDHTIKTTVKLLHAAVIRCQWHNYPRHVVCATNDKPVFEAIGGIRHWRIQGGVFDGANIDTPSCFLLCGQRDVTGGQCGDTTALSEVHVSGSWGHSVVANIAGEVQVYSNCTLWLSGGGDTTWTGPQSTIMIANADYWGLPYAYDKPNTAMGSTSANVYQNCDIRGGVSGVGTVFLIKGQVEDLTIIGTYLNANGTAHILAEAANIGSTWVCPRRIKLGGGGRTENNRGIAWNGTPVLLVDGKGQGGMGVYHFTMEDMGVFVGSQANSTPVIKTQNAGLLHALTVRQGIHIESTDKLLDHTTADLNWAEIRCSFNVAIDCTGKTIANCDIKTNGTVAGTIGTGTKVRSSNVSNW